MSSRRMGTSILIGIFFAVGVQAQNPAQLGNTAFEEGRFAEAVEQYKQALREKPVFGTHVNLGHSYANLERWPEAAASYQAAIELDPNAVTTDIWLFLGQAQYQAHYQEAALESFLAAASSGGERRADMWIVHCLIDMEKWVRAEAALSTHLGHNPKDRQALQLLAYVREQMNDWRGAIEVYRELVAEVPGETEHWISLANALATEGQTHRAIDALELAWRLNRSATEQVNRLLADLYLAGQMPREAALSYTRAIREMEHPAADDYFRLGVAYFQSEEFVSAKDAFGTMQRAEPNDFRADLYLGRCAAAEGDPNIAETYYRAAIAEQPSSTEALLVLAQLEMTEKQFEKAATHFAHVIQLGDGRPQVHYNHILSLLSSPKQDIRANAALKAALAQHPGDAQLRQLLERYVNQTVQHTGP